MFTEILGKVIVLSVGVLFLISVAVIYFRAKNVNRAEFKQIFKTAEYLSAWVILLCFVFTLELFPLIILKHPRLRIPTEQGITWQKL